MIETAAGRGRVEPDRLVRDNGQGLDEVLCQIYQQYPEAVCATCCAV